MTTQQRKLTADGAMGIAWWYALTEAERANWLAQAGAAVPVDACSAFRRKKCVGGPHRCAHAWNGRGGETQTAGAATRQVKVRDPRTPGYNNARRLAVGEFITLLAALGCVVGLAPVPALAIEPIFANAVLLEESEFSTQQPGPFAVPFRLDYRGLLCEGQLQMIWSVRIRTTNRVTGELSSVRCADGQLVTVRGNALGLDGVAGIPLPCKAMGPDGCARGTLKKGTALRLVLFQKAERQ